jgi:hypothetical protein
MEQEIERSVVIVEFDLVLGDFRHDDPLSRSRTLSLRRQAESTIFIGA